MQHAAQVLIGFVQAAYVVAGNLLLQLRHVVQHDAPDTVEEAEGAFYALVTPLQLTLRRSSKEDEKTCGISAVLSQDFLGGNNVAQGFTHLGAVLDDHALSQQIAEGLIVIQKSCIT